MKLNSSPSQVLTKVRLKRACVSFSVASRNPLYQPHIVPHIFLRSSNLSFSVEELRLREQQLRKRLREEVEDQRRKESTVAQGRPTVAVVGYTNAGKTSLIKRSMKKMIQFAWAVVLLFCLRIIGDFHVRKVFQ